uniref:FAS-associated factor 2 n=1 Tax=Phallusia mammillata TaxID=59560 RepID=A0A6F9DD40_9ASCI|nr:FAS-associated factor 2 [Phallusia mammillata]
MSRTDDVAADGPNSNISVEQTEKILHFQDITQVDDLERCRTILQQHNWNIQSAVHSTLNVPDPEPLPPPQPQAPQLLPQNDNNHGVRNRFSPTHSILRQHQVMPRQMIYFAGRHRQQPPQGIFGWGFFLLISPIKYTFTQVFEVLRFVWRIFFPDPREMVTNAEGDVTTFVREFQDKFHTHPNFFEGTYAKAQAEAKKELRFLLAFLHDPKVEDSELFCRESLCHSDVVEFINRNMILWGCSVQTPEGYRVSKILRYPECPSMAVVCLFQNKMTVVGRLHGYLSSQELINKLSEIVEAYESVLVAARSDRNALMQNQLIRQEQDAAYKESLQKDKEKVECANVCYFDGPKPCTFRFILQMDKKLKEEEEIQKQKEKKAQLRRDKEFAEEICRQRKESCKQDLREEPNQDQPDVVTLLIKMPDGSRLKRRFLPTDSVKAVHDYVYSHESSPPRFKVFTNFPRRAIPGCSTEEIDDDVDLPLLKDAGFHRNDSLFIQSMIDDDDDDEDDSDEEDNR